MPAAVTLANATLTGVYLVAASPIGKSFDCTPVATGKVSLPFTHPAVRVTAPFTVRVYAVVVAKTPAVNFNGPETILLAVARVTPSALLIINPPVPLKVAGNSTPVV